MGIFLRTNDSDLDFVKANPKWSFPTQLIYPDYMNPSHDTPLVGAKSGAMLLAQFVEAVFYQLSAAKNMANDTIVDAFYTSVPKYTDANGYITLRDGMDAVCTYINENSTCRNISSSSILWVNSIEGCKRYVHRNNYIIVEMKADKNLLNIDTHSQGTSFNITTYDTSLMTTKYSKCFICCGYDADGFVLYNSLGRGYGSDGFVKVSNEVFKQNFLKAATVNNIFG